MKLFKQLFASLEGESVQYMVAGGVALNLYGIERATADLDLIVNLERENLSRFVRVVEQLGLKPRVPVKLQDFIEPGNRKKWIEEKGMVVFSLFDPQNPFFVVDVFVTLPFAFDEVYGRRQELKLEDTVIHVVPIQELIAMKEESARSQDRADIFYLRKILEGWENGG